jgi:hypothetical protein
MPDHVTLEFRELLMGNEAGADHIERADVHSLSVVCHSGGRGRRCGELLAGRLLALAIAFALALLLYLLLLT